MTPEILVIAAIRIAGSLPVLRWPLAGGLLAVLVDLVLRAAEPIEHVPHRDLVRDRQREYFQYMAANMNDILDAYSVHIYWHYDDTSKFQRRLTDVRRIVELLPASGRKPLFVTEFGVRGDRSQVHPDPGAYRNGSPVTIGDVAVIATPARQPASRILRSV